MQLKLLWRVKKKTFAMGSYLYEFNSSECLIKYCNTHLILTHIAYILFVL